MQQLYDAKGIFLFPAAANDSCFFAELPNVLQPVLIEHSHVWVATKHRICCKTITHSYLLCMFVLFFLGQSLRLLWLLQAGHQAASTAVDSDSDDGEDFDQYSDLDAFDTDEVEVSPDDEQALAAFMVSLSAASSPQRCHMQC